MNHARTAIAATALALSAAALGAPHASATHPAENGTVPATITPDCHWAYHPVCGEDPPDPEINYPESGVDGPSSPADRVQVDPDWPEEGSGYVGYGDESSAGTAPDQGPPNYPGYDTSAAATSAPTPPRARR